MHTCLAENTTNLSHRSCQTVSEPLSPGWSKTWSMADLVMYCGTIVEDRKALGATFVCTTIYTTVENTGYTNDTHTKRTIKKHLYHKLNFLRKIRFLIVLRGEVSAVGEHSCKNGARYDGIRQLHDSIVNRFSRWLKRATSLTKVARGATPRLAKPPSQSRSIG